MIDFTIGLDPISYLLLSVFIIYLFKLENRVSIIEEDIKFITKEKYHRGN